MKKLMIVAAAATLAGVASASNVFNYKAAVKYVDYMSVGQDARGVKQVCKVVRSTTIRGFLVTPQDCACKKACAGREPGFLVVTTALAKKWDKAHYVKLLPANLLANAWATKDLDRNPTAALLAQGYLFAGLGKSAMPAPDGSPIYGFGDMTTVATKHLFGQMNYDDIDGQFVEPFLDAAGFGKAAYTPGTTEWCGTGDEAGHCLKNLKGSVIGGSWSCKANDFFDDFRCQGWNNEDTENDAQTFSSLNQTKPMYNVISGSWVITENNAIKPVAIGAAATAALAEAEGTASLNTAELVTACGQRLQKTFSLATFDADAKVAEMRGAFVKKWFAGVEADVD